MGDTEPTSGHDAWELSKAMLRVLARRDAAFATDVQRELENRVREVGANDWPIYAEGVRSLAKEIPDLLI